MLKYTVKRILQSIPIILIISILSFSLIQLAPYDAIDMLVTPNMSDETVAGIKAKYGLDQPAYVQYFYWMGNILRGDFGYSIVTHSSIAGDLMARLPATMVLVTPAYLLSTLIAVVLGLVAGYKKDKFFDKFVDGLCSIGLATPLFWMAMLLIYFLGYRFKIFPILGMHSFGKEDSLIDFLQHLFMPCTVLTVSFIPEMMKYIRSSTIGQLSEEYVTVQRAYGAKPSQILFRHVIKNVLLPVITILGMGLPLLVTGAFITESLFAWPGVGPYFLRGIQGFDYPIVLAVLLLSSTLVIVGNLLADILYGIVDPRIKELK